MPLQSSTPWDRITRIHPTHRLKSRGGSLTFQTEILKGHLRVEEGHHHAPQGHLQEEEVVEVVEVEVVEVEVAGAVEEHSHYPDTHLPNQLKNF